MGKQENKEIICSENPQVKKSKNLPNQPAESCRRQDSCIGSNVKKQSHLKVGFCLRLDIPFTYFKNVVSFKNDIDHMMMNVEFWLDLFLCFGNEWAIVLILHSRSYSLGCEWNLFIFCIREWRTLFFHQVKPGNVQETSKLNEKNVIPTQEQMSPLKDSSAVCQTSSCPSPPFIEKMRCKICEKLLLSIS